MSQRRALAVLLLVVAFLSTSNVATAQRVECCCSEIGLKSVVARSVWRVGRTLVFGGNANRVQFVVSAVALCQSEFRSTTNSDAASLKLLDSSLVGVKPTPLPQSIVARKPASNNEIAVLQRTYRKLIALGLEEEAAEIAALIVRPNRPAVTQDVVNAVAVGENKQDAVIQTAALIRRSPTPWSAAARSLVSCRFDDATLEDAAKFFRSATGCSIRVKSGERPLPRVHFSCQNLPVETALAKLVESCGWTYETSGEEVVIQPPLALPLRMERLPILR